MDKILIEVHIGDNNLQKGMLSMKADGWFFGYDRKTKEGILDHDIYDEGTIAHKRMLKNLKEMAKTIFSSGEIL